MFLGFTWRLAQVKAEPTSRLQTKLDPYKPSQTLAPPPAHRDLLHQLEPPKACVSRTDLVAVDVEFMPSSRLQVFTVSRHNEKVG